MNENNLENSINSQKNGANPFLIGIIAVAVLALGIWWLVTTSSQKTSYEGLSGVQGIVTSINKEDNSFLLVQDKLTEKNDEFSINEKLLLVKYTDQTEFIIYNNVLDVKKGTEREAGLDDLELNRNVIITPSQETEAAITAAVVRIMPGSTEVQVEGVEVIENKEELIEKFKKEAEPGILE